VASAKKDSIEVWNDSVKDTESLQINNFLYDSNQREFRSNQANSIEESYSRDSKGGSKRYSLFANF
jgi:hypothetical protein